MKILKIALAYDLESGTQDAVVVVDTEHGPKTAQIEYEAALVILQLAKAVLDAEEYAEGPQPDHAQPQTKPQMAVPEAKDEPDVEQF